MKYTSTRQTQQAHIHFYWSISLYLQFFWRSSIRTVEGSAIEFSRLFPFIIIFF